MGRPRSGKLRWTSFILIPAAVRYELIIGTVFDDAALDSILPPIMIHVLCGLFASSHWDQIKQIWNPLAQGDDERADLPQHQDAGPSVPGRRSRQDQRFKLRHAAAPAGPPEAKVGVSPRLQGRRCGDPAAPGAAGLQRRVRRSVIHNCDSS